MEIDTVLLGKCLPLDACRFKVKGKRKKRKNTMNKLVKMVLTVVGVGSMLGFAGCGLEDSLIQSEVNEMVREHVQEQEEIVKLYDVGQCVNFTLSPEANGIRQGTVDVELKNKKTGKMETLAYQFKYNTKSEEIEAGVKDPRQVLKLIGLQNLFN